MTAVRHLLFVLLAACLLCMACSDQPSAASLVTLDASPTFRADLATSLIPRPREIDLDTGRWFALPMEPTYSVLTVDSSLTDGLEQLVAGFAERLQAVHEASPVNWTGDADPEQATLQLELDPSRKGLRLHVTEEHLRLDGESLADLAGGLTTLLQLSRATEQMLPAWPGTTVEDAARADYRGLMIDLARKWHSVDTLEHLIELAALYKCNYLHLHFTDYQSYTLPSTVMPKLPTPGRSYTEEDLVRLNRFAASRGVVIVPEIDLPGHARPLVRAYPALFGLSDTTNNPYTIHMGREEVYRGIDTLLGELASYFPNSPYLHIGGDEAILTDFERDADVRRYMQERDLGEDPHELYRHFLVRIDSMVRRRGFRTCVWEGFRPDGEVEVPRDLLVFEFETNRYLPQELLRDGYEVVNTSWKPLYVVNRKKWSPKTIYAWQLDTWASWWPRAPSFEPIEVPSTEGIVGAEMCSWEQAARVELPSLRRRVPYYAQRLWAEESESPDLATVRLAVDQCDALLTALTGDDRQDELLDGHEWVAEMEEQ